MKKIILITFAILVVLSTGIISFADDSMSPVDSFENIKVTVDGEEVNVVSDGTMVSIHNGQASLLKCYLSKSVKQDSVVELTSAVAPDDFESAVMWSQWVYTENEEEFGDLVSEGISLEGGSLVLSDYGCILQVMQGPMEQTLLLLWTYELDGYEKVVDMINGLPLTESISISDKEDVISARVAYDSLSEDDKAKVTNYDKLLAAETKIADLEKAAEFDEAVGTLPDLDNLTEADYEKIAALKEKYDALTDNQKKLIKNEDAIKLAFEKLVVKNLKDELDAAKEKLAVAEETLKVKSIVIKKVKAKAQKKKTTVTWKSAGSGYKYEVYKSLKVSGGYKKATTSSKAKVVIKKLKSKKTYYVKVRGFKTVNGKTVYTQYSDVVSVKIK